MRHLILTRGTPASGKSTWIKSNGLEQYALEPDRIRLMIQSPKYTINGDQTISQSNDGEVWNLLRQMLETRMKRGELVIIDATHSRSSHINQYKKLAKEYRYRVHVINFDLPLSTILEFNRRRDAYKFVPEQSIRTIYERLKTDKVPSWVKQWEPNTISDLFEDQCFDFNDHEKIVVFGDIHGCNTALNEYFLANPYNEKYKYIFTGDYFDRGVQNADVFNTVYYLMQRNNVLCLMGNHEKHIGKYIKNGFTCKGTRIPNHAVKTFDEFEKAQIDHRELKDFYNRLGQYAYFEFNENRYVVTHGGIPTLPNIFYPTDDYIHGVGHYGDGDTVDETFARFAPNAYQIHGHRNIYKTGIRNTPRTFNLCGDAEFGGHLRILEISKEEHKEILIQNDVYDRTLVETSSHKAPGCSIAKQGSLLEYFTQTKDVLVKDLGEVAGDTVYSANFTNKVFQSRKWDEMNVKARGIFFNGKSEVVARSYEKFFNWGERPESSTQGLMKHLQFPVTVYEKENGFLGILSLYKDEWFIASKSTNKGEFADMFRELVTPHLTAELKYYLSKKNVSLIFEVIHHNDPHIIEYGSDSIILLDVVYNQIEFQKYPYQNLKAFAKAYNFVPKRQIKVFTDFKLMHEWRHAEDEKSAFKADIEGYVFEDARGFQWKYKGRFYNFWKHMRGVKDKIVKRGGDHTELRNKLHQYEDFRVYNWMIGQPLEWLQKSSLIEVRKKFFADTVE